MVARRVVVSMVVVGIVVLVTVVRVSCIEVLGVVGMLYIGALEVDCAGVVGVLVLGGVFVVEVVWCVNGRGYFLCRFSLKSVEMNGLGAGGFLLGMVIWEVCFVLLEQGFLGKMVGINMLIDVVVEIVVVETVDVVLVVQIGFFVFF